MGDENTTRTQRSIFDEVRGVRIADEASSRVLDMTIETKIKE